MPNDSGRPGDPYADAALDQLRAYSQALVKVIADHPVPSFEQEELLWRLEEFADELDRDNPSAPRVKSRWIRLVPVLNSVRPDIPSDMVTDLINQAL